jgi:hypothetical protein
MSHGLNVSAQLISLRCGTKQLIGAVAWWEITRPLLNLIDTEVDGIYPDRKNNVKVNKH